MEKEQILEILRNDQENGEGVSARPETLSNANHEMGHQEVGVSRGKTEEYRRYEGPKGFIFNRRVI